MTKISGYLTAEYNKNMRESQRYTSTVSEHQLENLRKGWILHSLRATAKDHEQFIEEYGDD